MQPDYNFDGSSKRTLWLVSIVTVLVLGIIAVALVFFLRQQKAANNQAQAAPANLTVGAYPYIYPCSVATIADYESAFGLSNSGNIGYQYENSAFANAKGDLTQIANQPDPNAGYASSCTMTIPKSATAVDEVSISVSIAQFSGPKGADDSLNRDQLSASATSANPNASPPTLPSFVTNSVVFMPSAFNNTVEASIAQNNIYITLDYSLQDGDTEASALPKLDAFAKSIAANANAKTIAAKPTTLAGHATFLNTPFVDVCRGVDFNKLTTIFTGVQFRPDSMTSDSQYGALASLPAASNGVVSNCGLTFSTAADRAGFQAFNSAAQSRALQLVNIYPQSLRLSMNTYASADAAKAAWAAKKTSQTPTMIGPIIQAVGNLGDEAYSYHGQNIFQKSAINQSAGTHQVGYTITEDDYVIVSGDHLITISFQQNSESDPYTTGPVPITQAQIQNTLQLFTSVFAQKTTN